MNVTRSQPEEDASASDAWLVRMAGLELGPMPWDDLVYMVERREMKPADRVRRETESTWKLAAEVEGLFAPAGSSSVSQQSENSDDSKRSSDTDNPESSDRAAVPDTVLQYSTSGRKQNSLNTAPPAFDPPPQTENLKRPSEKEFSLGDVPTPEAESETARVESASEPPDSEDKDNSVDDSESDTAIEDRLFDHEQLADSTFTDESDESDVSELGQNQSSDLNPRAVRLLDEVDVLLKREDQLLLKDALPLAVSGESESASETTRKKPAKRPTASRPKGSGTVLSQVPGGVPAVAAIGFVLLCLLIYSFIPGYEGADVFGQVTLDGKPLTDAMVTFDGIDSGLGATVELDSDGHYRVTTLRGGLDPGRYRISVFPTTELSPEVVDELQQVRQRAVEWVANLHMDQTAYTPGGQPTDGADADSDTETKDDKFKLPEGMIPIKYLSPDTSRLTYEVVDGENQYDIKLRSHN